MGESKKRKERKFPIKEWEKAKKKRRKVPNKRVRESKKEKKENSQIKEWEKEKEGKKIPNQGSKENRGNVQKGR